MHCFGLPQFTQDKGSLQRREESPYDGSFKYLQNGISHTCIQTYAYGLSMPDKCTEQTPPLTYNCENTRWRKANLSACRVLKVSRKRRGRCWHISGMTVAARIRCTCHRRTLRTWIPHGYCDALCLNAPIVFGRACMNAPIVFGRACIRSSWCHSRVFTQTYVYTFNK